MAEIIAPVDEVRWLQCTRCHDRYPITSAFCLTCGLVNPTPADERHSSRPANDGAQYEEESEV